MKRTLVYICIFLAGTFFGESVAKPALRALSRSIGLGVASLADFPPEVLTAPMPLHSNLSKGSLPAGTVLYPDAEYAEGFTQYVVFINFKGEPPVKPAGFGRGVTSPIWMTREK